MLMLMLMTDTSDDEEPLYYRIEDKPSWFLIETENGFLKDADKDTNDFQLGYEVMKIVTRSVEEDYDFSVSLYASDGEDESTRPLVLKFKAPDDGRINPRAVATYKVDQRDGAFYNAEKDPSNTPKDRLDVGPRLRDGHVVTFNGDAGFVFADSAVKKLVESSSLLDAAPADDTITTHYVDENGDIMPAIPDEKKDHSTDRTLPTAGVNYYLLKSTGAVEA